MNTGHNTRSGWLITIWTVAALLTAIATSRGDDACRWKAEEGKSLTLLRGDQVLWQFCYDAEQAKPYFHPVALPDGPVLTWNSPPDHRWHHGLWFSWKFIGGVNYWEPDPSGKPSGRTKWQNVDIRTRDDGTARIAMDLTYDPGDGKVVMTEQRVVEVSAPADDGTYLFDWVCRFTAGEEKVVLDRTPLPDEPGGMAYGGYAGLSVRFAQELVDREAATAEGPVEFNAESRFRGKSIAMDYNGTIDGRPCGIAILDHPQNLNSPTPWYAIRSKSMSYYSPAVLCYGPHTLEPAESFTLRYRVLVHEGRWVAGQLAEHAMRYAQSQAR